MLNFNCIFIDGLNMFVSSVHYTDLWFDIQHLERPITRFQMDLNVEITKNSFTCVLLMIVSYFTFEQNLASLLTFGLNFFENWIECVRRISKLHESYISTLLVLNNPLENDPVQRTENKKWVIYFVWLFEISLWLWRTQTNCDVKTG